MMKTLLLICALGTPQTDGSITSAEAVIQAPDATSRVQCGLHGHAYIAQGAIAEYLDGAHSLKITCTSGERLQATNPAIRSTAQATD